MNLEMRSLLDGKWLRETWKGALPNRLDIEVSSLYSGISF